MPGPVHVNGVTARSLSANEKLHTVYPGKGIDSIQLFSSSMQDVLTAFGREGADSAAVPIHAMLTSGECIFYEMEMIAYRSQGLEFRSRWAEGGNVMSRRVGVEEVSIRLPARALTREDIALGTSVMQDVLDKYGKRELTWDSGSQVYNALYYGDKGICFFVNPDSLKSGTRIITGMKIFPCKNGPG
jgi:hypothetical protein